MGSVNPVGPVRRLRYEPGLDGVRGIGAIFVVLVHLGMIVIPATPSMPTIVPGAYVFMDLFFVVSGFLITNLLISEQHRTGRTSFGGFYLRRGLRLLPALWVMLLAHVIYAWAVGFDVVGGARVERDSIALAALYGINFRLDTVLSPVATGLTHLWSLGIEEQFYALWPLAVAFVLPVRRRLGINVAILGSAAASIAVYRFARTSAGDDWMRLYTHTDTRADSLLIGALTAYLWAWGKTSERVVTVGGYLSVAAIALYTWRGDQTWRLNSQIGFTLMAIASAFIVLAAVDTDWAMNRILTFEPLRRLGVVSYGVYLWHVPVFVATAYLARDLPSGVRVTIALGVTALATALSWRFVEQPCMRIAGSLRRRIADRRPPSVATAPLTSATSSLEQT